MKTKFNVIKFKETGFKESGNSLTEKAGQLLAEAFKVQGKTKMLKEQFGITLKEDMTTTNASGVYTTMLSSVLYTAAVEKIQPVLDLVFENRDLINKGGFGAYKIPRDIPTIAVEVAEGSVVAYHDEGADAITVTPRKVVVGTALTWEIVKRGMTDFVKYKMKGAADAIARKMASDVVNGLSAGAGSTTTGGVSYATISTSIKTIKDAATSLSVKYGFEPNKLVLNATSEDTFYADTDVKSTLHYANIVPSKDYGVANPVKYFRGMEIVVTPHLTASLALVIDSEKAAMLVKESDLETFEGEITGRPYDKEVVALQSYALGVLYPYAICKITA